PAASRACSVRRRAAAERRAATSHADDLKSPLVVEPLAHGVVLVAKDPQKAVQPADLEKLGKTGRQAAHRHLPALGIDKPLQLQEDSQDRVGNKPQVAEV